MNGLTESAIVVLLTSVALMGWGFEYRSDHLMGAVGALFGAGDPTYSAAGWAIGIGILAFLVGIALLVGGLVRPSDTRGN